MARNKVPTGIEGVDKMLFGGIPEFNQVVLAGGPGAGKTLFGFEYLYKGAKAGEPGLLFSLEEDPHMIVENAKNAFSQFDDIDKLIADKKLIIYDTQDIRAYLHDGGQSQGPMYTFGKLVSDIESIVESTKAKRVVVDSLSLVKLLMLDQLEYRNVSIDLVNTLRRLKVTAFLIIEIDVAEKNRMLFQPEFFIYDGIITMYSSGDEGANRALTLEIIKMRGTKHSRTTVPYEITPSGLGVLLLAQRGGL